MKKSIFLAFLMMAVALSSCKSEDNPSSSSPINNDPYFLAESLGISLKEVKTSSNSFTGVNLTNLESIGKQNILVIPVDFNDYPSEELEGGAEVARANINAAFFGESEDTGWESVKSYYKKSSYDQLHIDGFVSDWFHVGKTLENASLDIGGKEPTWRILEDAVNWYKDNASKNKWPDIKQFDQNEDGYLDAVWLIYSVPFDYDVNDNFQWAFTYWDYEKSPNKNDPLANVYAWGSYYFMFEGGYDKPDAHTYIHETGHIMGLDDYYTYDSYDWGSVGLLDMMDGNIGDHNAYSKSILGWTKPYVVQDDCTIKIRPFVDSGDFIIIGNNWNGSMFDEYLMLEYYTPTSLNQKDSLAYYPNSSKMFSESGIKVYHVDARLGTFKQSGVDYTWKLTNYTDEIEMGINSYSQIVASNTASKSLGNKSHKLIHLLESSGTNSLKSGRSISATNAALFKEGRSFGITTFKSFTFNDSSVLPFAFEITDIAEDEATITFFKR